MGSGTLIAVFRSLITPPLSLLLLFAIAYAVRNTRPRLAKTLSLSLVSIFLLISTNAGAWLLVYPLEHLERALPDTKNTGAQAIVILSAGSLEHSPEYGGQAIPDYIGLGRIRYAAKLYRDTALPILVSGGFGSKSPAKDSLASAMASALQYEFAIPVLWQEDQARNTYENAQFSARILQQAGITRVLLVTDAMHMRRAKFAFDQTGLVAIPAPTLFFSSSDFGLLSFIPGVEGLRRSNYAMHEWLGLIQYWLFHTKSRPQP
ncbi:YdcF family protein [Undibacterium parvum]|uniref:YdcF family protein n=2 Tax=Undibacterium TaxID=401469 RepID=A0A6M4A7K6_9BURK|nr:YdcF family protein [Undibacterium parvum]AZP13027.1 YdcF family protein [Undibacterium parvum]QJQ07154.1 YdcF family protein [Undibacterium piscinae]